MATGIFELPVGVWKPDPTLTPQLLFTTQNDPYLAFDDTIIEKVYVSLRVPSNRASADVLKIQWSNSVSSTANIVWQAQIWKVTPNSDTDDAIGSATFATTNLSAADAGVGTRQLQEIEISLANFDSAVAGDRILIKLFRDGADAGDTMTEDGYFYGATYEYST